MLIEIVTVKDKVINVYSHHLRLVALVTNMLCYHDNVGLHVCAYPNNHTYAVL